MSLICLFAVAGLTQSAQAQGIPLKAVTCTAVDAPAGESEIPASADCGQSPVTSDRFASLNANATGVIAAAASRGTVAPTTVISSTPITFDTTDGDLLAITKVSGATSPELAIGGNFKHVITPDGVSHAALNFAIVSETTGTVLFAGNANSYVRAITSDAGITYLGGDFTKFGGVARAHAAALSPTFALTAWNPSPTQRVKALAVEPTGVYVAGYTGTVRKVSLATGSTIWTKPLSGGGISSMLVYGGFLYVGGLFETYDNVTQHGLVKVQLATGTLVTTFNAHLRADTGMGSMGAYDGEEIISMAPGPDSTTLIVGDAGHGGVGKPSNEARVLYTATGATKWLDSLIGDGQGVGLVGDTVVAGYHRNVSNTNVPYPYFAAQLEFSNGALTNWDPRITGNQYNADGGNNGVQAIYVDPTIKTIFLAGAFTQYNNTNTHKSLIAFRWT